jgi:hypothetical protein
MVGQITGLSAPLGLAIDVADNLYVGNQDSPTVPVYAPPYTGAPILTPNTTGYLPQGVAVSAKGVVAVMNFCNSSSCELYDVSFYAKNSTTPCVTVAVPSPNLAVYGAFDRAGNLYLAGQNGPNDFIGEIKGGCKATNVELLKTNNAPGPALRCSSGQSGSDRLSRIRFGDYIHV